MLKRQPVKRKIFLSHSSKDRAFVLRLVKIFESNRISYWYSATHIKGAKQWHDEIGRALGACNWFLVVLTPDAVRSQWVKRELLFALDEDRYNRRIIPLLYKSCKYSRLSWTLPAFELVDFRARFDYGCEQLLRVWGLQYEPKAIARRSTQKKKTSVGAPASP